MPFATGTLPPVSSGFDKLQYSETCPVFRDPLLLCKHSALLYLELNQPANLCSKTFFLGPDVVTY
jgi:hypothetical protein